MKETLLITGANRGIGLEFVRQYAKAGANIIACCRDPKAANELQTLQKENASIQIHSLDITSADSIAALKQQIKEPIDILLNVAGMLVHDAPLGNVSKDDLVNSFLTNAVGTFKMTEAFTDHLVRGKRKLIACISSSMGSIAGNVSGGYYSYRSSKAALNMLMKSAGFDLQSRDIKV